MPETQATDRYRPELAHLQHRAGSTSGILLLQSADENEFCEFFSTIFNQANVKIMTVKDNQQLAEYYFEEECYISEFWNENTDPDVSIARARVMPGQKTRKHSLRSTVERYCIISGTGEVFIGDAPGQQVQANDIVYIPADVCQHIANHSDEALVFLAICSPRFEPQNYIDLED